MCIFFQFNHDRNKVICICIWRDGKHTQNLLLHQQIPVCPLFLHSTDRRAIYPAYEGKPPWLHTVIGWQIACSWRMWLAGGFITVCKTFSTLMCNRALLPLCCCSDMPFASHYKHPGPAFENLTELVSNGPIASLSLTEFKHFHMSLWHKQRLEGEKTRQAIAFTVRHLVW